MKGREKISQRERSSISFNFSFPYKNLGNCKIVNHNKDKEQKYKKVKTGWGMIGLREKQSRFWTEKVIKTLPQFGHASNFITTFFSFSHHEEK